MTKEATISFRVESELREDFNKAAALSHQPASQILRELMHNYIKQAHNQTAISLEERERRDKAVRFARASLGLEGFELTPEDEAQAQRFIQGEIDMADFLKVSDGSFS